MQKKKESSVHAPLVVRPPSEQSMQKQACVHAFQSIYALVAVGFHFTLSLCQSMSGITKRDRCVDTLISGKNFSQQIIAGPKWQDYDYAALSFALLSAGILAYEPCKRYWSSSNNGLPKPRASEFNHKSFWFMFNVFNLMSGVSEMIGPELDTQVSVNITVQDSLVHCPKTNGHCFKQLCDELLTLTDSFVGMVPFFLSILMGLNALLFVCKFNCPDLNNRSSRQGRPALNSL